MGRTESAAAMARCEEVVDHLLLLFHLLEIVGFLLTGFEVREHLAIAVSGLVAAHLCGPLLFESLQGCGQLLLSLDGGIGGTQHGLELSRRNGLLHGGFARLVSNGNFGRRLLDGTLQPRHFQLQPSQHKLFLLLHAFAEAQHRGEGEAMGHGGRLSGERHQLGHGILVAAEAIGPLLQEGVERRQVLNGTVEDRIGIAMIGADADEIF